jgi:hypothetical protein
LLLLIFAAAEAKDIVYEGITYDDDTVATLITVMNSTSPVPSIPETTHLYKLFIRRNSGQPFYQAYRCEKPPNVKADHGLKFEHNNGDIVSFRGKTSLSVKF